jgi:membrane protease YdiL (CAAX protease family)
MNNNDIVARKTLLVILWSYGLYIIMYLHQYLGTFIAARMSGKSFEAIISGEFKNYQTELIIGLTAFFIGIPLVFLVTRFLWRRSFEWIRLQFNFKYLLFGLLLGFLLPFVVILILKILGFAKIAWSLNLLQSKEAMAIIVSYACMAIFSGIAEEVVYRGMAVREIAVRNGWLFAVIIGGVYFGAAHLVSKLSSITLADAFWIILASVCVSFLFVALYIRSKSLWLPIGFHIAWNFCLKGIVGMTMSGNESEVGLLNVELTGNAFLTGGSFGIEASIVSLVIYILIAFLFVRFPWRGHITLLRNK